MREGDDNFNKELLSTFLYFGCRTLNLIRKSDCCELICKSVCVFYIYFRVTSRHWLLLKCIWIMMTILLLFQQFSQTLIHLTLCFGIDCIDCCISKSIQIQSILPEVFKGNFPHSVNVQSLQSFGFNLGNKIKLNHAKLHLFKTIIQLNWLQSCWYFSAVKFRV